MFTIGSKIDEVRIDGCLEKFKLDLLSMKKKGFAAVELPAHGLDVILNGRFNHPRMEEILSILKEFDFQYSVHAPNPINLMDRTDAGLHKDVLLAACEFAKLVKAKVLVYHAGRFIPEEEFNIFPSKGLSQKKKEFLMEREARLLQSVSEQYPGVNIAMENARPYLIHSPYSYGEFIEDLKTQVMDINRDNVRINLDFGHLYMTSLFHGYDLEASVSSIKHLVVHTHIHDNFGAAVHHWEKQQTHQLPFGKGDSHMPVGWGDIPIKQILQILLPDYTGLFMMELRSRYFNYLEESKQNLEALLAQIMIEEDNAEVQKKHA